MEGGFGEYTYSWINENGDQIGSDSFIDELAPGEYTITVYDENYDSLDALTFCSEESLTLDIPQLNPLTIYEINKSDYNGYNISCDGFTDGAISISIIGGTPPYIFNWYDSDFNIIGDQQNISNLSSADANNLNASSQLPQ